MTQPSRLPNLANWLSRFDDYQQTCPWPGPRPLRASDAPRLVGRAADLSKFRHEVETYRLVLLTGASGVGKSSLLDAGLVPTLQDGGYTVAVCRDWGGRADELDPATFLAGKVRDALSTVIPDLPRGAPLFGRLEKVLGYRAVLILDQFEELIRYVPSLTSQLYDLLIDLNHATHLRLVISFRSEYLHMLRPLETGARPFTVSRYVLEEIHPGFADEVVSAVDTEDGLIITEEAVTHVADTWRLARETAVRAPDGMGTVGLLHLQALLYALHAHAGGATITVDVISSLHPSADPRSLFVTGLLTSIDVKLARCRQAALDTGVDRYLLEGTAQVLAAMVTHLSSGGFKLIREAKDLANVTLKSELSTLLSAMRRSGASAATPPDGDLPDHQFDTLVTTLLDLLVVGQDDSAPLDLLASDHSAVARAADARGVPGYHPLWIDRLHLGAPPWVADPAEVTSGPLAGLAPSAALIEELRRFVFALAWLQASSLVRLTTPGDQGFLISLIHDGFGVALERWSNRAITGPQGAVHALTAPGGAVFDWSEVGQCGTWLVLPNLRWRGSWVRTRFREVIFVNCDMRGTYFDKCVFEGVTFVNCLLDGVVVSDCHIVGTVEPATGEARPGQPPTFVVDLPGQDIAAMFARYRGTELLDVPLFSPLPGLPAVPANRPADPLLGLHFGTGGLTVYGGRLSSLVVRSCLFPDDGIITLRHVAGFGLDVVEQSHGRLEIFGSALRHVSITAAATSDEGSLDIRCRKSCLVHVWLGDNLSGTFQADDCALVHVWNASAALKVVARESSFHGIVNVATDSTCASMGAVEASFTTDTIDPGRTFAALASTMAYRRNPGFPAPASTGGLPPRPSDLTGSASLPSAAARPRLKQS